MHDFYRNWELHRISESSVYMSTGIFWGGATSIPHGNFYLSFSKSYLQNQNSKVMLVFRAIFAAHFISRIIRHQRF